MNKTVLISQTHRGNCSLQTTHPLQFTIAIKQRNKTTLISQTHSGKCSLHTTYPLQFVIAVKHKNKTVIISQIHRGNCSLHTTHPLQFTIAVQVGEVLQRVVIKDECRGVRLVGRRLLQPLESSPTQVQHHLGVRHTWHQTRQVFSTLTSMLHLLFVLLSLFF